LLGIAQTGTGKTAAFALPILHRLAANRIAAGAAHDAHPHPVADARTGQPDRRQLQELWPSPGLPRRRHVRRREVRPAGTRPAQGLDVLVATPGRLLDHMQQKTHRPVSQTEIFVLDEADQMLDLGFVKPIRQIVSRIPAKRQNLFFSATMPTEIGKLAGELLKDPVKVQVTPQSTTVQRISQSVMHIEQGRKRALLTEMFADDNYTRCLVFTKTKHGADKVAAYLEAGGVQAGAIHGNKSPAAA
jgi:ATP-dependent RNA helicase RhlE